MARGDLTLFQEFVDQLGQQVHDLNSDTLKLGIVDDTITPAAGDSTPTWSDYSANEVGTDGNYVAGGVPLTYAGVTRWEEAAGVGTLDADDISIAQDASGFTDGYWGILYNDDAVSDQAIAFVDLGGPVSEVDGPIEIAWNASGILTIAVS